MKKIGKATRKPFSTVKEKPFKEVAPKRGQSGGKAPNMKGLTGGGPQPIGSLYSQKPTKAG